MTKETKPDAAEKSQKERFKEAVRDTGADKSGKEFERAFKKIVKPREEKSSS